MTDNYTAPALSFDGEEILTLEFEDEILRSNEHPVDEATATEPLDEAVVPFEDEITLVTEVARNEGQATERPEVTLQPGVFSGQFVTGDEPVLDETPDAAAGTEVADPAGTTEAVVPRQIIEPIEVVERPGSEKTDETEQSNTSTGFDDGRIILRHQGSDIRRTRSIVLTSLANTGKVFEQGGSMVTLKTDSVTGEVTPGALNSAQLVLAVDEAVAWERFDSRKQEFVRTAPRSRSAAPCCART
ncbi:hypothetical protein [Ramlibacter montanisoli]|uniref:Uncharacterized protein n=1 Tax=Ramlibacter montanisoli TaxID=2732512 RepID=A0A849KDM3_9BURK|nr:hypothetical protein [Ramlibacter montanisoli]NNU43576.1 hypothetical protein [Ramlibacter montanisoli]